MSDHDNGPRLVPAPADDPVGELLRRAGRRAEAPAEHTARVKAAVEAQWQWTVRAERRRGLVWKSAGWLAAAATLVLAIGLAFWRRGGDGVPAPVATLETATGSVWGVATGAPMGVGEAILADTRLETRDDGARAVVRLAGGGSLRLDVATRVRLVSSTVVALERGAVYLDSGAGAGSLEVATALGTVRDVGTRFEVRLDDSGTTLRVRVRAGNVALERGADTHLAGAGMELAVRAGGAVVAGEVPAGDDVWAWTRAILPVFAAEGRSLSELLLWAAGEGGLELRFADPVLEARAAGVVLHGEIEGLGLEDAVALAVLSSGLELRWRVEHGVLLVEPGAPR